MPTAFLFFCRYPIFNTMTHIYMYTYLINTSIYTYAHINIYIYISISIYIHTHTQRLLPACGHESAAAVHPAAQPGPPGRRLLLQPPHGRPGRHADIRQVRCTGCGGRGWGGVCCAVVCCGVLCCGVLCCGVVWCVVVC
jgi:hypothetical protein